MKNNELIKKAMKERNISTIKELSLITGVSRAHLYKLTEDENTIIGKIAAEKLNRTLGLNLDDNKIRKDDNSLGYKFFKLRCERNWTKEYLSNISNVGLDTLYTVESNRQIPSRDTVKKLITVFEVEDSEFLEIIKKWLFQN